MMNNESQTSFIPKKALSALEPPRRRPGNIFLAASLLVLFASALVWGGSFFYRRLLDQEINQPCQEVAEGTRRCGLKATVDLEEKNLDRATILDLQRLDVKLKVAGDVLSRHSTVLPLFRLLEELTLPTIRYTSFNFGQKGVNLAGTATAYEDIAVQMEVFGRDRGRIKSFLFSDFNLNAQGEVVFKLVMEFDSSLTSYAKNLSKI